MVGKTRGTICFFNIQLYIKLKINLMGLKKVGVKKTICSITLLNFLWIKASKNIYFWLSKEYFHYLKCDLKKYPPELLTVD